MESGSPHFSSSELKQRHAFIDRSIEQYTSFINKAVEDGDDSYLGPCFIEEQFHLLDMLEVPNYHHGTLKMPTKALKRGTYIPIWALPHSEGIVIAGNTQDYHPVQTSQIVNYFQNRELEAPLTRELLRALTHDEDATTTHGANESLFTAAFVSQTFRKVTIDGYGGKNPERILASRPGLFIYTDMPSEEEKQLVALRSAGQDIVGHELVHVAQMLARPVFRYDTYGDREDMALRQEFEAYEIEEALIHEHNRQGLLPKMNESFSYDYDQDTDSLSSTVFNINAIRREVNAERKDPYFPDGKIRKRLAEQGLAITGIALSDQERSRPFYSSID